MHSLRSLLEPSYSPSPTRLTHFKMMKSTHQSGCHGNKHVDDVNGALADVVQYNTLYAP